MKSGYCIWVDDDEYPPRNVKVEIFHKCTQRILVKGVETSEGLFDLMIHVCRYERAQETQLH